MLKCPFQPGAWSKRYREHRPLTGVGRLGERKRAGDDDALQCRAPLTLGVKRSPTPVKGGIAHATGWQKRNDALVNLVSEPKTAQTHHVSRRCEPCKCTCYLTLIENKELLSPLLWLSLLLCRSQQFLPRRQLVHRAVVVDLFYLFTRIPAGRDSHTGAAAGCVSCREWFPCDSSSSAICASLPRFAHGDQLPVD